MDASVVAAPRFGASRGAIARVNQAEKPGASTNTVSSRSTRLTDEGQDHPSSSRRRSFHGGPSPRLTLPWAVTALEKRRHGNVTPQSPVVIPFPRGV